jgi:hypothetical protein
MTAYVMEAKENYPPAVVTALEDDGAFTDFCYAEPLLTGLSFDAVRRKIMFAGLLWSGTVQNITNTSGYTLWGGVGSFGGFSTIPPGDPIDQYAQKTLAIFEKDIDTGVVTAYPSWSAAQTVPNGIGPGGGEGVSDGTWRRYTLDLDASQNYPALTDPRTGNVWVQTMSCETYCFRRAISFAQDISPIFPAELGGNQVKPIGMSNDWVFVEEIASPNDKLYVTPRVYTAAEISADYLLKYATYDMPDSTAGNYWRICVYDDGDLYLLSKSGSDGKYKLWRFDPPALGAYPATGGGFTEITPWAAATGPNTSLAGYANRSTNTWQQPIIMKLPDDGQLALWTLNLNTIGPDTIRFDVTYYDIAGDTFETFLSVASTYMTAEWASTEDPNAAAYNIWPVVPPYEVNNYLDLHDYNFAGDIPGLDYRDRWIAFVVFSMEEGVAVGNERTVFVRYLFTPGAAPTVVTVIDELTTFDPGYTTYATAIGLDAVVQASLFADPLSWQIGTDKGLYDPVTNAFWWSGHVNNMFYLDPALIYRDAISQTVPPLLRLSFGPTTPPRRRVLSRSQVGPAA